MEDITRHLHGVVAFDDAANQLMGISMKYMCLLSIEATSIVEIAQNICNKQFIFTLSIRTETFYGIARLKVVTVILKTFNQQFQVDIQIHKLFQLDT